MNCRLCINVGSQGNRGSTILGPANPGNSEINFEELGINIKDKLF